MKLPRDVSGTMLIAALRQAYGYQKIHQVGSHVILEAAGPHKHRLCVPDHKALRVGTLDSILRAVSESHGLSKEQTVHDLFG